MGCFGYICKGCGTSIRGNCMSGGEKCVLIHVRHGKEIGRVEGHYDEYGRVIEQEGLPVRDIFRGDGAGPNGHSEICTSEFDLQDSHYKVQLNKIWNGQEISLFQFIEKMAKEAHIKGEQECSYDEYEEQFAKLQNPTREVYSGIAAWHSLCYNLAADKEKRDFTPSFPDPNQSWDKVRKKYI